ncbi:hypothetical protein P0136_08185 [Lentisphaerota bacterium ZTH]|nr:hypothetical protein JYG24_00705 [Lentisphaerota bacterium]WET05342.1 hypothetical protein P0136_08185 [Lentisphaerota bacterium ZTH]
MSWDGKNFDRPLIMLDFETPQDAIKNNNYKPDEDVEPFIKENMTSEQLILVLRNKGMTKEACDFMSYCVNRRVGVWWAYSCVDAVNTEIEEEQKKCPLTFEEKVKKDVEQKMAGWKDTSELDAIKDQYLNKADSFKAKLDQLNGPEATDPNDPLKKIQDLLKQKSKNSNLDSSMSELESVIASIDPEQRRAAQNILDKTYANYEAKHGIHPFKEIEEKLKKAVMPEPMPEDTTMKDQFYGKIQEKIDSIKQYIENTMGKHFPLDIPGLPKKASREKIDEALFAVKRWILTPTDENGKIALDSHKPAVQEPEGVCALAAYWSCANLTPGEKTQLIAPPGLYSVGVKNTVFMCAMKKGGSKKYAERYEEYFNIGIDCVSGVKTWDKEWKKKPAESVEEDDSNGLNSAYGFGR